MPLFEKQPVQPAASVAASEAFVVIIIVLILVAMLTAMLRGRTSTDTSTISVPTLPNRKVFGESKKHNMNTQNSMAAYRPSQLELLGWKLFPFRSAAHPKREWKSGDTLVCHIDCYLSFADRVRILISGQAQVQTRTTTENVIGEHQTESSISVMPPRFLTRNQKQYPLDR